MLSESSRFAARLREFIDRQSQAPFSRECPENADFNRLALELFSIQFAAIPPYRRWCETRAVSPASITRWTNIPTIPTVGFKELDLSSVPPDQRTTVFHSSGTTGHQPSRHFHSAESLAVYEASAWPWFHQHLLAIPPSSPASTPGSAPWRLAVLAPTPAQAPRSSLALMFGIVQRHLDAPDSVFLGRTADDGSWILDLPATRSALALAAADSTPLLLLGTAFSFVHLLDDLAARNLRFTFPAGSRVMETGGYKGRSRELPKQELHQLLSRSLGIPPGAIVCEYGMSELSSQAYDRVAVASTETPQPRQFHFPPWARARIVSPETGAAVADGETGLLRVFDLANVFSVMAIQTEDLAIRRGDGFELIGRTAAAEPRGCSLLSIDGA